MPSLLMFPLSRDSRTISYEKCGRLRLGIKSDNGLLPRSRFPNDDLNPDHSFVSAVSLIREGLMLRESRELD